MSLLTKYCSIVFLACCCVPFLGGCSTAIYKGNMERNGLRNINYGLVDEALACTRGSLAKDDRILVTTTVNVDDYTQTNTFGRLVSQQLAGRLTQRGYTVANVNVRRNSIVINPQGEFLLTRDIKSLCSIYNAKMALVATYNFKGGRLFVSTRCIRVVDGAVIGAADADRPLIESFEILSDGRVAVTFFEGTKVLLPANFQESKDPTVSAFKFYADLREPTPTEIKSLLSLIYNQYSYFEQ